MSTIKLPVNEFTPISEGEHTFYIAETEYHEPSGNLKYMMVCDDGRIHINKYAFKNNGKVNDKALASFAFFARGVTGDWDMDELDPLSLNHKYCTSIVEHSVVPSRDDPTKNMTFIRLTKVRPATELPAGCKGLERLASMQNNPKPAQKPAPAQPVQEDTEDTLSALKEAYADDLDALLS